MDWTIEVQTASAEDLPQSGDAKMLVPTNQGPVLHVDLASLMWVSGLWIGCIIGTVALNRWWWVHKLARKRREVVIRVLPPIVGVGYGAFWGPLFFLCLGIVETPSCGASVGPLAGFLAMGVFVLGKAAWKVVLDMAPRAARATITQGLAKIGITLEPSDVSGERPAALAEDSDGT